MLSRFIKSFYIIFVALVLVNCANRGTPSGGDKDTTPPIIVKSVPENFSTNFTASEIRIYFDEYIKIKNVQRQLIISPPMDPEPIITPLGSASKYIKIKILDTLQPNTTYAFNFGQSIVDNNEENPYSYYKYVFSTGDYIDSLSVKGLIFDAEKRKPETFVSVMLYDVDSTYTDSIIYKQKPKYVTNTLDSTTTFNLENLKAGKYLLVALKEENNNFTFQQKTDKIAFNKEFITVPSDSIYNLKLFKEETDFKAFKPNQAAGQKIAFGYEGNADDIEIELLDEAPENYKSRITKDKKTDTLYYWYKPEMKSDSAFFVVKNKTYMDTLQHRFRDIEKDSLKVGAVVSGGLNFYQDFEIEANTPLTSLDEKKVTILDKDSANVSFTTAFKASENRFQFKFDKTESNTYKIQMLPGAITDFFSNTNDTLNYTLKTKSYSDFSNIRVSLKNAVYPIIVQLTDEKGEMKYEQFATEPKLFDFKNILPSKYYLRVIYDTNGNQKWDTGSFLKKQQPERISYDADLIDARAGWDWIEEFTLD